MTKEGPRGMAFVLNYVKRTWRGLVAPSGRDRVSDLVKYDGEVATDCPAFGEVVARSAAPTDVSDHLVTLFAESLSARPNLIVELGVRGGESTAVFERVADVTGARLVSVDIEDCSGASSRPGWLFVCEDDLSFARRFPAWCDTHGLSPSIDVLFIDTVHEYDHTVAEIDAWFPFLSPRAKVIFHDTNLVACYTRSDGSCGWSADYKRGVIRAVEDLLQTRLNEKRRFTTLQKGWMLRHDPFCCGLLVMEKVEYAASVTPEG